MIDPVPFMLHISNSTALQVIAKPGRRKDHVVSADIAYGGEKEDTYVHVALYIAMVTFLDSII